MVDINLDDQNDPQKFNDVIFGPMLDQLRESVRSINPAIEVTL
jgi:hypothetical protein